MTTKRYLSVAINQKRTSVGIFPKAACGIAVSPGWRLSKNGEEFLREGHDDEEHLGDVAYSKYL